MLDFLEAHTSLYDDLRSLPAGTVRSLGKWRGKIKKLLKTT
jgi:hypothetical protein